MFFFLLPPDDLGLDSNEPVACRLDVATARSSRSRLQHRPSAHNLNGLRAWSSAARTHRLHISKSWREHHRKHIAKVASRFALMSTSIANCKFRFFHSIYHAYYTELFSLRSYHFFLCTILYLFHFPLRHGDTLMRDIFMLTINKTNKIFYFVLAALFVLRTSTVSDIQLTKLEC